MPHTLPWMHRTHERRHPAHRIRALVAVLQHHGVPPADALRGTGPDPAHLADPRCTTSIAQHRHVCRQALGLAAGAVLAFGAGAAPHLPGLGACGLLLMSCASGAEYLRLATRYQWLSPARVVVNDLTGGAADSAARDGVDAIHRQGGQALLDTGDVTRFDDMAAMAARTLAAWGRIDILVNNAGVLRDRTFAKMPLEDFRLVLDVHVMGAVNGTKAVRGTMVAQGHGRIVMTTSSSGLYGNFGQSNYGAAKMALVGLMQTLALEGAKRNIRVNCLAPTAATGMTAGVLPAEALARLSPERVSPGLLALVGDDAPTRMILLAGAGSFEAAHVTMTRGVHLADPGTSAEALCGQLDAVRDRTGEVVPETGWAQYQLELRKADASSLAGGSAVDETAVV